MKTMAPRLKEKYMTEVRKRIQEEFGIKNPMAVPKVEKIVLNMGMGEAISNAKILDAAVDELGQITGVATPNTDALLGLARLHARVHGLY